ncbi:hypothetical protein AB0L32_09795, partial [Micrococcus luteus]
GQFPWPSLGSPHGRQRVIPWPPMGSFSWPLTYGRKGMGWLRDPKRAAYNAVYRRTTVGLGDVLKMFK